MISHSKEGNIHVIKRVEKKENYNIQIVFTAAHCRCAVLLVKHCLGCIYNSVSGIRSLQSYVNRHKNLLKQKRTAFTLNSESKTFGAFTYVF